MDFINRGMLLAAILLLSFVPFVVIVQALAGRSSATSLVRRFGLSPAAATAVSRALTSPSATSGALDGVSFVFMVLGGIAAAAAIQELYERAFDLPTRGLRDAPRRLAWLAALMAGAALVAWAGPWLRATGGTVLSALFGLAAFTGFWWFTMWWLLAGRVPWRELLPSAVATAVCWLGMSVVFKLTMSSTITSKSAKYGAVGVVISLMSFLVAIGFVIILGAIIGVVWRERRESEQIAADVPTDP